MLDELATRKGVRNMAVMAIKKPSAYIVKVGSTKCKDEFIAQKGNPDTLRKVQEVSSRLRSRCMSSKSDK